MAWRALPLFVSGGLCPPETSFARLRVKATAALHYRGCSSWRLATAAALDGNSRPSVRQSRAQGLVGFWGRGSFLEAHAVFAACQCDAPLYPQTSKLPTAYCRFQGVFLSPASRPGPGWQGLRGPLTGPKPPPRGTQETLGNRGLFGGWGRVQPLEGLSRGGR